MDVLVAAAAAAAAVPKPRRSKAEALLEKVTTSTTARLTVNSLRASVNGLEHSLRSAQRRKSTAEPAIKEQWEGKVSKPNTATARLSQLEHDYTVAKEKADRKAAVTE